MYAETDELRLPKSLLEMEGDIDYIKDIHFLFLVRRYLEEHKVDFMGWLIDKWRYGANKGSTN